MHQPDPQSRSYTQVIHGIELGTMRIPQFQREFVWPRQKSAKLIDSILKGYPIGTFILWKTKEQLRFVRDIGGVNLPPTPVGDYAEQVLDGQQRLTSLYAAVKGLTLERSYGSFEDFSQISVDLDADADTESAVVLPAPPAGAEPGRHVRLVDVLTEDFDFLANLSPARRERLRGYSRRVKEFRFSVILIQDAPIDVATEIFTRINVTGKPLSVFEIMVAKTYDHDNGFDLAERYHTLLEELTAVEYETIPPSAILQIASLVMTGEARKQDILRLSTVEFRKEWPRVEDAVRSACDYLRTAFRIPASRLLPYAALVVPIAVFFYRHPDKPSGSQIMWLRELFWRISLTGRYTSATETKLAQDAKRVVAITRGEEPEYDASFAVDVSPEAIERFGFFRTSRSFIKAVLCLLAYQQPRSFDTDGLFRVDNDWLKQANSKNYHHFFPKSVLERDGVAHEKANHVANITIVDDFLNKRKIKTRRPSDYMKEFSKHNPRMPETMATHLIDLDEGVWDDDYGRFFAARCRAISAALHEWVPRRAIDRSPVAGNRRSPPTRSSCSSRGPALSTSRSNARTAWLAESREPTPRRMESTSASSARSVRLQRLNSRFLKVLGRAGDAARASSGVAMPSSRTDSRRSSAPRIAAGSSSLVSALDGAGLFKTRATADLPDRIVRAVHRPSARARRPRSTGARRACRRERDRGG